MPNVRIKDQTTDTALTTGDYVIVDSESEGTRKYDLGSLESRVTALEEAEGSGLTNQEKSLILTLFSKAAYAEDDAKSAYDTLEGLWRVVYRTITYNLTNCISTSSVTSVENGKPYSTSLSAQSGFTITTATVTMGGTDVTASYYNNGSISIPQVTGDVVITAVATKALNSINATYTQSGTVYDTAALDDLKSDLVVIANYSDGTSETVTDYTLSGTLAEGTSTITVAYGGKTTTFNVTVSGQPISDETKWTDGVAYTYTGVLNEYVDKTNGSLVTYNAWDRTTYLYCSGASTLTFDCVTTNSQGGASNLIYNAFYDANKNFLSAFSLGTNMSTAGNTADVTVPSGAVYFVASGKQSLYAYRDNTGGPFVQITPKA